ncbi:DDE-type integrase/transposase/recombinase [Martelella sp. FLE1502]
MSATSAIVSRRLNNHTKKSHLRLRKRERVMQRFRSPSAPQRFICVHCAVQNLFAPSHQQHLAIEVYLHRLRA